MIYSGGKPAIEVYSRFASQFGATARPLSANDDLPGTLAEFAGLFLTGGEDVDPSRYGDQTTHPKTQGVSPARDAMELDLIARFVEAGKPVVGICRGLQVLAVHFSGRLHQHIPDILDEQTETHRVPGRDCVHPVVFDSATQLGAAMQGVSEANSAHHQSVDVRAALSHLRVAARSPAGIVEAVECFEFAAPIIAVQWHPERLAEGHPAKERLAAFIRSRVGRAN